jgi:hypothetical protein
VNESGNGSGSAGGSGNGRWWLARPGRAVAGCAVMASAVAACGVPAPAPAPPLEQADFVIAGVPADADSTELRLSFGEPDSISRSPHPYDAAVVVEAWYYEGLVIRYEETAVPSSFIITGGSEATARGVRVGDPAARVRQRYGDPDQRVDGLLTYLERAPEGVLHALEFLLESDTVVRIHLGRVDG